MKCKIKCQKELKTKKKSIDYFSMSINFLFKIYIRRTKEIKPVYYVGFSLVITKL